MAEITHVKLRWRQNLFKKICGRFAHAFVILPFRNLHLNFNEKPVKALDKVWQSGLL